MYRFFNGLFLWCSIDFHCDGNNFKTFPILKEWMSSFRTPKLIYQIKTTYFSSALARKWMVWIRNDPQTRISIKKKLMATKNENWANLLSINRTQRKNWMHVFLSLKDLRIKLLEKFNFWSKIAWKFSIQYWIQKVAFGEAKPLWSSIYVQFT